MYKMKKISVLLLMAAAAFFLVTGCQPVAQLYNGNLYKDIKTFPLDVSETTQASLETFEMKTSFDYRTGGPVLSISGTAAMGTHYQLMYDRIKVLNLFLFFLDDSNYVIDGVRLYHGYYVDSDATFPFEQEVPIPAAATQIAVGYEATFTSTDSDGNTGGGEWIYKLPLSGRK